MVFGLAFSVFGMNACQEDEKKRSSDQRSGESQTGKYRPEVWYDLKNELNREVAISETQVRLARLRMHLEEYVNENNCDYPLETDPVGSVLYKVLSGDYSGEGKEPTGPVYWRDLIGDETEGLVGRVDGKLVILDGFGRPFRYRSALDKDGNPKPNVRNEDYDLWSVGPDGLPAPIRREPTGGKNAKMTSGSEP